MGILHLAAPCRNVPVTFALDVTTHIARMSIFSRVTYAMHVLIAVTMALMLALSIGQGMGVLPGIDIHELMFDPLYVLPVFVFGLVVAPVLSERLPVSGDAPLTEQNGKVPYGYTIRILLLALVGLALTLLMQLVVFIYGKFS